MTYSFFSSILFKHLNHRTNLFILTCSVIINTLISSPALSATIVPLTVNLSEPVIVTGTPRININVGGESRYATYTSGSGSSSLIFNYTLTAGDIDLDGITLTSPIDLNGGSIKDTNNNNTSLAFTIPDTSGIKVDYPSISMNFVSGSSGRYTFNTNSYNNLSSFLSSTGGNFSRASTGTYYDATGVLQTAPSGSPRFDYDPITHTAKGILIEEQRTNIINRSSEFDNAYWTKQLTTQITPNITQAPDGTMTADLMYPGTSGGPTQPRSVYAATAGNNVISIYAKAAGLNWVSFIETTGHVSAAYFNLSNGTIGTVIPGYSANIQAVGNGWYRCTVIANSGSFAFAQILVSSNNNSFSTVKNGTDGIYIWGVQMELGKFSTSYIPTTTSSATRNADIITIPTGSWYNQSAGSFANDVSWISSSGTLYPMFFRVDDGTSNNRWNSFYSQPSNALGVDTYTSSSPQGSWAFSTTITGSAKIAGASSLNNANSAFNGTLQTTDTSWNPPSVTQLKIQAGGAQEWHKTLKYYPIRVSDAQLQLLTQ